MILWMGTYSAVRADLACERCGSPYRAEVQFYTGDDRKMPVYDVGQKVPALPPGSAYDGIADAFCAVCAKRWVAEEKTANFEALADAVEAGEIIARFATYHVAPDRLDLGRQLRVLRSEPLAPAEVRSLASYPEGFGSPNFPARLLQASVTLFRGDVPLVASPGEWWSAHVQRVRARLSALGWRTPPDDQFREVVVRVRADGTIGI
jgi:hypothetical protein